jgi:3'-phosphoadenosine 5'-phosphosulfate sulfotransferase (PAPS reductase)/FAD synthetase
VTEHVRMFARREPADIIADAWTEHAPTKAYVMFSGGKDSSVTLDYLWRNHRDKINGALHINTGIAVPETSAFARRFCDERGIAYHEYAVPSDTYESLVERYGFPGAMSHRFMYINLKQRAMEAFMRDFKTARYDRIALLTGVRYSESIRRMGNSKPVSRVGSQVWVAPLIDFSNMEMHEYREQYSVQMSEASRTLHMSGDCLCGAYAQPGELAMVDLFHPDIAKRIRALQERVAEANVWRVKHDQPPIPATWGWEHNDPSQRPAEAPGPLCVGCVGMFEET